METSLLGACSTNTEVVGAKHATMSARRCSSKAYASCGADPASLHGICAASWHCPLPLRPFGSSACVSLSDFCDPERVVFPTRGNTTPSRLLSVASHSGHAASKPRDFSRATGRPAETCRGDFRWYAACSLPHPSTLTPPLPVFARRAFPLEESNHEYNGIRDF